jgi:hypothetical protein
VAATASGAIRRPLNLSSLIMPDKQMIEAINLAFYSLSQLSTQLYDFWISELYCLEGHPIYSAWNSCNLGLMQGDIMQLSSHS